MTFKNKNLFKNLSSLIFQLVPFLYKPLVLSLAWKILGSYTRIFAVLSSTIKSNDLLKKEQRAKDSDSFSLEIRDGDLKRTNLFALGHQRCWWESLFCRGGGAFWNVMGKGGGGHLYTAMHIPLLKFSKMLALRCSLAPGKLFAMFTVSFVFVIHFRQCIRRQLFRRSCLMVPLR